MAAPDKPKRQNGDPSDKRGPQSFSLSPREMQRLDALAAGHDFSRTDYILALMEADVALGLAVALNGPKKVLRPKSAGPDEYLRREKA